MKKMNVRGERVVADLVGGLEKAWNAADGVAFARPFAEDADFVNVRGEHFRTRDAIAKGHQGIFNTIYKGSVVHYQVIAVRAIAPGVLVAHARSTLKAPTGPSRASTAHFLRSCSWRTYTICVSPPSTTHW
jgi:uncharacterized protein (TIGR02246 family)